MKWIVFGAAAFAAMVALAALVGALLPQSHHASRTARFRASPETVYALLAGPPTWRSKVATIGELPPQDGRARWWEQAGWRG